MKVYIYLMFCGIWICFISNSSEISAVLHAINNMKEQNVLTELLSVGYNFSSGETLFDSIVEILIYDQNPLL